MLEAARRFATDSPSIHMSTNKVYGDGPNRLNLVEKEKRVGILQILSFNTVFLRPSPLTNLCIPSSELQRWQQTLWCRSTDATSPCRPAFLRGGCLTGPNRAGVEFHGFLSYLVPLQPDGQKTIKSWLQRQTGSRQSALRGCCQVHVAFFAESPVCAGVYNLGGE